MSLLSWAGTSLNKQLCSDNRLRENFWSSRLKTGLSTICDTASVNYIWTLLEILEDTEICNKSQSFSGTGLTSSLSFYLAMCWASVPTASTGSVSVSTAANSSRVLKEAEWIVCTRCQMLDQALILVPTPLPAFCQKSWETP